MVAIVPMDIYHTFATVRIIGKAALATLTLMSVLMIRCMSALRIPRVTTSMERMNAFVMPDLKWRMVCARK
jgi:hypothetical protein